MDNENFRRKSQKTSWGRNVGKDLGRQKWEGKPIPGSGGQHAKIPRVYGTSVNFASLLCITLSSDLQ